MICIGYAHSEREIAEVQSTAQLRSCHVGHAPVRVHFVGKAGFGDQPVEGCCALGYRPARMEKDWHAAVSCNVLEDARRKPLSNHRAKRLLRLWVLLSRRMVTQKCLLQREHDLGHH